MKKCIASFLLIIGILFSLSGCNLITGSKHIADEKDKIVLKKYGELEYVIKDITIYKSEKSEFESIKGVDYIISKSGNRGSVSPYLAENFYLLMDIVKQDGEYKLLLYNNIMKRYSKKEKMFVLVNYFLPLSLDTINSRLENYEIDQDITNFSVELKKKDINMDKDLFESDPSSKGLREVYYNKIKNETFYMTFYDDQTGNIIIGTSYDYLIGNEKQKEIYYPENVSYQNIIDEVYDTLGGKQVLFSTNKGLDYKLVNDKEEEFDIWNQQINNEIYGKIFFYAYTYEEFVQQIDEIRDSDVYYGDYPTSQEFDQMIASYDESFFDENILLFYYKSEGNISENYVYSVTINDETLTLNVNRFEGTQTALSSWLEIVTIKKEDIINITKIDLIVRTIEPLADSVYIYIEDSLAREFYVNPDALNIFENLTNVKDIALFHWSLNVDLKFNISVTDDDVSNVVDRLENNPNVESVGYTGKDFIRVQLKPTFYDKVVDKTLNIKDFIDDEDFINQYKFTISIMDFTPFVTITFALENKGKENASSLVRELLRRNYPFLKIE